MAQQQQHAEDQLELPGKISNQGTVRTIEQATVLLNGFQMSLSQSVPQVYQFELKFISEKQPRKGKPAGEPEKQELEKGPRNDESKETRRRLCYGLFQQLLAQEEAFFGREKRIFVYDCAILLYSPNELGIQPGQSREFVLNVDRNALEERCRAYIRNMLVCRVNLLRTEVVINLRNAAANYVRGDRSVVQFLELLTSQRMFEQGEHYCFGNRFYDQRGNIQMRDVAPILKKGLQKNVRYVGDSMQDAQPIVQIDPKKSAFFPAQNVVDFLRTFCSQGGRPMEVRDLENALWGRGNAMQQANKQIRGVVVQTTHLREDQITFATAGLTDRPAQEITFPRQGQQVGVVEHFEQTYNMRIRCPRLPCLIKRTPQAESYFPMEVLVICDGQRVSIEKQTPKLTEQMIRECQVLPSALPGQIDEQRNAAFVQNANPFFQAQNVRVNSELMKARADLLYPPALQYNPRQECIEPDQRGVLDWKMVGRDVNPNRQYVQPAEWPRRWAIIIVQNVIPTNVCQDFIRRFTETARSRGLADCSTQAPIQVLWEQWAETSLEFVEEKFKFFADKNCRFVMFFAEGKRRAYAGDIHHVIKLMEQRYNVLTQHIGPDMTNKAAGATPGPPGGAQMVIENILFKTNLKLGGVNWSLVTSTAYRNASRNRQDVLADIWLGGKRMFFGLDWSHAPPQTLFERKKGQVPAIPTIIGMAYTIGKQMLAMRGTYWCQQPRQTTVRPEYMAPFLANVKEALIKYETENGSFPDHLFILRGGASEGEFKRVAYWEGGAFTEAFKAICSERRQQYPEPAVTVVVCQRQSNYRIVPERIDSRAKAPQQNVQPGTVVDKGVMNAALTEFLLVGHKALQGTAQPVRCTVVYEHRPNTGPSSNIPRVPVEELENIVYALCYSHGICCMATALPGPLFEAGELTKRGRNNWKTSTNEGEQVPHFELPPLGEGQEAAQQILDQQKAEHFARVSQELQPNFPTKYWA